MPSLFRIVVLGLLLAILTGCQSVSVMTYNLRLDVAVDGENAWPQRKDFLVSQLQSHSPDIFGTQEGLPHQIAYLDEKLVDYDYIGNGRNGNGDGEFSAIFYKRDKLSVEQEHTFWLSETPSEKSMGWDAALPRICTYGLFTDRNSGDSFWVFNTHLDHIGVEARREGVGLILERIETVNMGRYPVVFMGDFNAEPEDELIVELNAEMDDTRGLATSVLEGSVGTFNAFQHDVPATRRIDYIYVSKSPSVKVERYSVIVDSRGSQYPSDHFPVIAKLKF